MPQSYVQYLGNGSTTTFAVPFPYINKAHVTARVDGVQAGFTWSGDATISLSHVVPGSGSVVEVRRTTPNDARLVDFVDGSTLTESDLDQNNTQFLYLSQEAQDRADEGPRLTAQNTYDFQGRRATNLADPVNAQDAVTKTWAETSMTSQVRLASGYAYQASLAAQRGEISATDALNSSTAAAGSALDAGNSKAAASASATAANTAQVAAEYAAAHPDFSKLGSAAYKNVGVTGGVASFDDPRLAGSGGGGAVTAAQITDSSASGRAVLTGTPTQAVNALVAGGALKMGANVGPNVAWQTFDRHVEAVSVNVGGLPDDCFPGGNTVGCYNGILGAIDIKTPGQNNASTFAAGVGGIVRSTMSNPSPCGVFGAAMANTPDNETAQVFPANFVVTNQRNLNPYSTTGVKRAEMYGIEIDMEVHPADDGSIPLINARGIWITGNGRCQPQGEFTGVLIGPAGILRTPIVPWKKAFRSQEGAAQVALEAGELTLTGACSSQPITMRGRNAAGQKRTNSLLTDQDGNSLLRLSGAAFVIQNEGASTGITLRADGRLQAINADITGALGVGGNATVNGQMASGSVSTGTLAASSNVTVGGNATVNGTLAASTGSFGNITFNNVNVQLTASGGAIPPGYKALIVAG